MDRIYRCQRYLYDATRWPFLPGRDVLIHKMKVNKSSCILEIGCGTGRNLIRLSQLHPSAHLFGLDISEQMLSFARRKVRRSGNPTIALKRGAAEDFHYRTTVGAPKPFDIIFFSYSLSMVRDWRRALHTAFPNLKSTGRLYIVDFYDFRDLLRPIRALLRGWLGLFHVHYDPECIRYLQALDDRGAVDLKLDTIGGRYAFMAELSNLDLIKLTEYNT